MELCTTGLHLGGPLFLALLGLPSAALVVAGHRLSTPWQRLHLKNCHLQHFYGFASPGKRSLFDSFKRLPAKHNELF